MKKIIIFLFLLLLAGCTSKPNQNDGKERIYLSNSYYNEGKYIKVTSEELKDKENESYLLFTYNSYCNFSTPVEEIFEKFMKKYKIDILSIPIDEYKNTNFYEEVKYAPTVLIVKENEIIAYLDAESDEDLNKYQDSKEFENWLNNYIYFNLKN